MTLYNVHGMLLPEGVNTVRTLLMLQSVNNSKTRNVRNTILILKSVEVAKQGLSGIGY
jgi:hypothetical protein